MENTIKIFNDIKNTSGRLDKEQILRDNQDNEEFKYFLNFLLDPFIVTGIGKKKLQKFMKAETGTLNMFKNFKEVTEYVQKNNTGSDEVVDKVAAFIKLMPYHTYEFHEGIIRKDLKIGVTGNTVNKIYGKGFISQFKVQLAKSYEDEADKIQGQTFVLTEKLDGMRLLTFVNNGVIKCFSRSGKPVVGLVDIENEAKELPNGVYDGELVIANAGKYNDRDVLQETLKISRTDGEKRGVVFHVFDYITLDEFEEGITEHGYDARRVFIEDNIVDKLVWIKTLPVLYRGTDHSVIPKLLKELEDSGKEGLMLNIADSKWQNKRTGDLLKIKSMNEFDERIIDFVEGEGKLQGTLGAVIVNYKDQNTLNIGSGFTESERDFFWANRDKLLGHVITVQYFRESINQKGQLSVSFPVFKRLRDENKEVSYY